MDRTLDILTTTVSSRGDNFFSPENSACRDFITDFYDPPFRRSRRSSSTKLRLSEGPVRYCCRDLQFHRTIVYEMGAPHVTRCVRSK